MMKDERYTEWYVYQCPMGGGYRVMRDMEDDPTGTQEIAVCNSESKAQKVADALNAAWNSRAGGGEPDCWKVTDDDGNVGLSLVKPGTMSGFTITPLYTHPAPAVDAGEVERLVDRVIYTSWHGDEKGHKAARAALIEHVTGKGER